MLGIEPESMKSIPLWLRSALICRLVMTPGIRALVLSGSCFVMAAAGLGLRAQEKPANGQDPRVSFNREILPILSNNCFACHGPDEKARKTRFHFDTEDGAFTKRGSSSPATPPRARWSSTSPATHPGFHRRRLSPGRRWHRNKSTSCPAGGDRIQGAKWASTGPYVQSRCELHPERVQPGELGSESE